MRPAGTSYTLVAVGVITLVALVTVWKIYRTLRSGVLAVDLNLFNDAPASYLSFERMDFPRIYWVGVGVLTLIVLALATLGIVVAKAGVS